jgi:5'(3')-deoxyribonucleotidase
MMVRITLDMDDVMADTNGKLIDIVLNEFNTNHSREDFRKKSFKELLHPKQQKKLHTYIQQPGFFKNIPVMQGAVETVTELANYYEIYIATAAMEFPNSFREKYDWLQKHFPFIPWNNVVFCGDKSVIASDYLIDDHIKNLVSFRGKGILFSAPQNLKETSYQRVNNWAEIGDLFLPKT